MTEAAANRLRAAALSEEASSPIGGLCAVPPGVDPSLASFGPCADGSRAVLHEEKEVTRGRRRFRLAFASRLEARGVGARPSRAFHPDPRAKLGLLLLWAVAVFLSPGLWYEIIMMLLAATYGIAVGKARLSVSMLAFYAVMMSLMVAVSFLDTGVLKTMLSSFFMLVRKVFPCGLLAAVIVSTTHVNEFMSAFSRMRVPRQVTIPLAVMLRYIPAIREDWRFIKDAMRMRGVSPSLAGFMRRPGMTVECLYVPLMMGASNVADELSMASVARGIENPAPRTCFTPIEFRASDGVLLAAGVAAVAVAAVCSLYGIRG